MFNTIENHLKSIVYNRLKTINELSEKIIYPVKVPAHLIKICVIDDEGFDYRTLNSLGFKDIITHHDFQRIEDYSSFNVILCDIDGVGRELDKDKQGLAIVHQLISNFPNTLVFIFSGKTITDYGDIPKGAKVIEKRRSMSDIGSIIIHDYSETNKPSNIWHRYSEKLMSDGISMKTLAFLEDLFVKSILDKSDYFTLSKSKFKKKYDIEIRSEWLQLLSTGIQVILAVRNQVNI